MVREWSSSSDHLGIIADIMRHTCAAYHYAIKFVKRNKAELIKQRFVEAISANHSRDFWTEVNRMKSNGSNSVCSVVDGLSDCSEITELFADKYEDLNSCVSYDEGEMMTWYTIVYHGIPWFTRLTPRYSMAHHVRWGSSYTHCCRALTFVSAGLSCC